MAISSELLQLQKLYTEAQNNAVKLRGDLLIKAFMEREYYGVPEFLWRAIEEGGGGMATVWGEYRHDGCFISVYGVHQVGQHPVQWYTVDGIEHMEYCNSERVSDITTYDYDDIVSFILLFLREWDEPLHELAISVRESSDKEHKIIAIESWADKNYVDLDIEDDYKEIVAWAESYKY